MQSLHDGLVVRVRRRYPQSLDADACLELDRLMAMPAIEFKKQRAEGHLVRIAYSHYFIQRDLIKAKKLSGERRHLKLRVVRAELEYPFGKKSVLGLIVGVSLKERESLDEEHIVQSAMAYLPGVRAVKRSYFSHHDSYENVRLIYLEIEKVGGGAFSTREVGLLKRALPEELERRVENLVPNLFVTQNQEEVFKSILLLSRELRYVRDLPQVMIVFEEQLKSALVFSVIITRVLRKGMKKWDSSRSAGFSGGARCVQVNSQIVGYLRKTFPKEAIVLRLQIPKEAGFLRIDSSIDLYLARERVCSLIREQVGEFRDYNGGLISKRLELVSELKQIFRAEAKTYPDLLENIFYSIIPMEMQVVSALKPLEILMGLFFEGVRQAICRERDYFFKVQEEEEAVFVFFRADHSAAQGYLQEALEQTPFVADAKLISASVHFRDSFNLGYIYRESCLEKRREFLQAIRTGIHNWHQTMQNTQVLKLGVLHLPLSLDPRLGGDRASCNILRMLYEGLMRIGVDGVPAYGVAESFELSEDLKRYTFRLREARWSNGKPISAYDFEYAWKKILSPSFKTPFSYLFYPIKNAKLAKEGILPPDAIGVRAVDERTLEVDLESPTPHFLELTAHTLYSPVNHTVDVACPDWSYLEGSSYVCNGPFRLEKLSPGHGCELVKNESYWDKQHVNLDKIFIFKSPPHVALERYRKHEIDWLGKPLSSWEPYFCSKDSQHYSCASGALYWYVCNTTRFPFNHVKIRQALGLAINRKEIIQTLSYDGLPAATPLPLIHTFNLQEGIADGDVSKAQRLFEEALQELGLTKEQFPFFSLIHTNRTITNKVAQIIQQQWKEVLGISCRLEGYEWADLFSKMVEGDYDVGAMGWIPAIDNPLYTLDVFKSRENPVNFSRWENQAYLELLDEAVQQGTEGVYRARLAQAEKILLQELPIIPIFYEIEKHEKQSYLKGVNLSEIGNIDFKSAYIAKKEKTKEEAVVSLTFKHDRAQKGGFL
jgi:oligopeptide transport system substrate-binding protein